MRFFLADVETTGVKADDSVCEIAWCEISESMEVTHQGYSLINPGKPIHYAASAINGITDEMVTSSPTLEEYMDAENYPLHGDDVVLIAHSASFDHRFLKGYMSESAKVLCTLKLARRLYPDAENHKQATLAAMLGVKVSREKAHSADGDLLVLLQILKRMCLDSECSLTELLHIQAIPRKIVTMPFGKHKGQKLSSLPASYVKWVLSEVKNLEEDLRIALSAV